MIIKFLEGGPPLSDEDIKLLESSVGVFLPSEYRKFLLRQNGGRPTPNAFSIRGLANNPFGTIHYFFGIGDAIESCNLDWNYAVLNGRLPSNLIAIADDPCGDLICLTLFGDDAGSVVFWDRHTEPNEPSYENVYQVAESFKEFLDGIQKLPVLR